MMNFEEHGGSFSPDKKQCVYLEQTHMGIEDSPDIIEPGFLPAAQQHHYTCAHTGRANGPDYRPACPRDCTPHRTCFHGRDV